MKTYKDFYKNLINETTINKPVEVEKKIQNDKFSWTISDGNVFVSFYSILEDKTFIVSFSFLDPDKNHVLFNYYVKNTRNTSDDLKFGDPTHWVNTWQKILHIIRIFINKYNPTTIKFAGMSSSKRIELFKKLINLFQKHFRKKFNHLKYKISFDEGNNKSLVIKKIIEAPNNNEK